MVTPASIIERGLDAKFAKHLNQALFDRQDVDSEIYDLDLIIACQEKNTENELTGSAGCTTARACTVGAGCVMTRQYCTDCQYCV